MLLIEPEPLSLLHTLRKFLKPFSNALRQFSEGRDGWGKADTVGSGTSGNGKGFGTCVCFGRVRAFRLNHVQQVSNINGGIELKRTGQ